MARLVPGANAPVPNDTLEIHVRVSPAAVSGGEVDVSGFLLTTGERVRSDNDMVFYGQPSPGAGHLAFVSSKSGATIFRANLSDMSAAVEKIAFTTSVFENRATFSQFSELTIEVLHNGSVIHDSVVTTAGMKETALILGQLYRHNGEWKFKSIAQGFNGGLKPLAEHFGVTIDKPSTGKPTPASAPAPKISLAKVSLTKSKTTVSLEKKSGSSFGTIRVNLNWNQGKKTGLLGGLFGNGGGIDLDLGCLFELADGTKGAVQALGNALGAIDQPPYIELDGDDRTGSSQDGEWMTINGAKWAEIKRVCIYAFIYEGVANWSETDGVIRVIASGQPEIEVRLVGGENNHNMCGVVLLENDQGQIKMTHIDRYFSGHVELDKAFNWNMRWQRGSK